MNDAVEGGCSSHDVQQGQTLAERTRASLSASPPSKEATRAWFADPGGLAVRIGRRSLGAARMNRAADRRTAPAQDRQRMKRRRYILISCDRDFPYCFRRRIRATIHGSRGFQYRAPEEALPAFATSSLGSTWRLGGRGGTIPLGRSRTNAWRGFASRVPPPEEPVSG